MNKHKLTMEIVEEYFLDFTHDHIPLDVTVRLSKLMLTLLLYDKKRKHELDDYWYYFFSYALNIWREENNEGIPAGPYHISLYSIDEEGNVCFSCPIWPSKPWKETLSN